MSQFSTCLWFSTDAEDAVRFYVSIVPGSAIGTIQRGPADWPGGKTGDVLLIEFTLGGQSFLALNAGSHADYNTAASLSIRCNSQADVDRVWNAILDGGGSEIMCGWIRDRWGVPWQVVPESLPRLLADPDPAVSARVFAAIQKMVKLDSAILEQAAAG